ncbi:hypothetical protein S40293_10840 [Stachybotrys chartarum IBT 40293]|nr:hypothetical protein S40293_10840 [Stachybotrys chartarum IBT 40293]
MLSGQSSHLANSCQGIYHHQPVLNGTLGLVENFPSFSAASTIPGSPWPLGNPSFGPSPLYFSPSLRQLLFNRSRAARLLDLEIPTMASPGNTPAASASQATPASANRSRRQIDPSVLAFKLEPRQMEMDSHRISEMAVFAASLGLGTSEVQQALPDRAQVMRDTSAAMGPERLAAARGAVVDERMPVDYVRRAYPCFLEETGLARVDGSLVDI